LAETIRGINVQIGAETTGLTAALSDVNRQSRNLQSELRSVERLLQMDPSNVELVAQQQQLLARAVENSREKLDRLRLVQEQVDRQFANSEINEAQYRAFQREVASAEQELRRFENRLESTGESANTLNQRLAQPGDRVKSLGQDVTVAGAAMAAGLGLAVKTAADFEKELSNAKAVSGATTTEMAKLKEAALEMGATTSFSATQAAGAMTELLKGGMSTEQVLGGGLKAALDLAAAGELEMADAAAYVIKTMGPFNLSASQAGDIANTLAGAANASATDVDEMGQAMAQVATIAAQMGGSMNDTATALALFANKGLVSSDAGTSLKTMLMRLVPSTDEATEAFQRFGLMTEDGKNAFFDASGQMKSMSEVSELLKSALGGLSAEQQQVALNTMFGSDAIRAAAILTTEGSAGFDKMAESISKISAADVADEKLNNLYGSLTLLQSSLETAAIAIGDALLPAINKIVSAIQVVIQWFNSLDGSTKSVIATAAAIAAALALLVGPLLILIGSIPLVTAGFTTLTAAIGAVAAPIGITIAAIAGLVAGGVLLYKNWDTISAKAAELWQAIENAFSGIKSSVSGLWSEATTWGSNIIQGLVNGISSKLAEAKAAALRVAKSIKDAITNFFDIASPSKVTTELGRYIAEGLAKGIDEKITDTEKAAQRLAEAVKNATTRVLNDLNKSFQLESADLDLQTSALSDNITETEKLQVQLLKLQLQQEQAIKKVEALTAIYEKAREKLDENSDITQQYAFDLQMAQIEMQKTAIAAKKVESAIVSETQKTAEASKQQVKSLQEISDAITEVEVKYRDDLSAALDEYQTKVTEVNNKLIEQERQVTAQYEQEIENRTKSLMNFVGLFDQVQTSDVTGEQLLGNLQGQVDTFEQWQANIQKLAERGIDEGLLESLKEMGPSAASEVAALLTLTDAQLQQYSDLWLEKTALAREEATEQLENQRVEMEQKISEIRQAAKEQLELYKAEWEKKNAEIRKNAEEEMEKIEQSFKNISEAGTKYGVSLMANFIGGIESKFSQLQQTLESMTSMVDSYMPHSPAKRGPLSKIMEWGPALVGSLVDGINASLPKLEAILLLVVVHIRFM